MSGDKLRLHAVFSVPTFEFPFKFIQFRYVIGLVCACLTLKMASQHLGLVLKSR